MRRILLLILATTLQLAAQTPAVPRLISSPREKQLGLQLTRMKTDDRIAFCGKQLQADPGSVQNQLLLASAFLQKMRETTDFSYLNRARSLMESVLEKEPDNYDALRIRLEIEMQLHEFPAAAEQARLLVWRNASDAGSWGLLGDALMELGKYDEAGKVYQRMLTLAPGLASYNRVAYHRFVTGHPGEALAMMKAAVEAGSPVSENEAWCLVELGDLLFKTGNTGEAESAWRRALEIFPSYHRAWASLGRWQAASGKTKEAIDSFQHAQAVVPLPEYAATLEALLTIDCRKEEAARQRKLLEAVEKLMTMNGEKANRVLAMAYADVGRNLDRALQLVKAEFDVRNDVYTWDSLAWVLYKANRTPEAEQASEKALALRTPEPLFYYHAGMIALAAGKNAEAQRYFETALSASPHFDFQHAPEAREALAKLRSQSTRARPGYFSSMKLPTNMASMPEE